MIPVRNEIFWDIDFKTLNPDTNKSLIIERVLSFGNLDELQFLFRYYSVDIIRQTAKNIGYLDPETFDFVTGFLNIDKEEMKCYIKKQSATQHWS